MSPSMQQTNARQSTLYIRVVGCKQPPTNKAIARQMESRPNLKVCTEDQMVKSVPQVRAALFPKQELDYPAIAPRKFLREPETSLNFSWYDGWTQARTVCSVTLRR